MNVIWRNYICCLRLRKVPHRCHSGSHPVAPLGSRILTDPAKVFEHNMWDHMQWSKEEEEAARKKVEENSAVQVIPEEQDKYESEASKYWDVFYKIHKNKFFKNRNWLLREFPEIFPIDLKTKENARESSWDHIKPNATNCFSRIQEEKKHFKKSSGSSNGPSKAGSDFSNLDPKKLGKGPLKTELFPGSRANFRILEVGCGAGNSVFPILNTLHHTHPTEQPSVLPLFMMCAMMAYPTLFQMGSWMSFSLSLCSLLFILTDFKKETGQTTSLASFLSLSE